MTSNEERRDVAARLRELDASKWSCFGQEFDALIIASLMTACGCNFGQDWQDIELKDRLADLIEPEPERTCVDVTAAWSDFGENVFNDDALDDFDKFEKVYQICQENFGAKVVE